MALILVLGARAEAAERLLVEGDRPMHPERFTVSEDGEKLYLSGLAYLIVDREGKFLEQIGVPRGSLPRMLIPIPGGFLACNGSSGGFLGRCGADGQVVQVLVKKGLTPDLLRGDMTEWTSPQAAAVDPKAGLIFALDETVAPGGGPVPGWSRIAVFDFQGRFVRDFRRFDITSEHPDKALGVWYDDIEVDPTRQRVYVVTRPPSHVLALDYEGRELGRWAFPGAHEQSSLAVFDDGRVAVGSHQTIQILDSGLKPRNSLTLDPGRRLGLLRELETDASGRLYASTSARNVTFLRWGPDLKTFEVVGPRYLHIQADPPESPVVGSLMFSIPVQKDGTYTSPGDRWQVFVRDTSGEDPRWQYLPCRFQSSTSQLLVARPSGLSGSHVLCVRFGRGPVDLIRPDQDPSVELSVLFAPENQASSVSVLSTEGREAFRQGEEIPIQVVSGSSRKPTEPVRLELTRDGNPVMSQTLDPAAETDQALSLPQELTRRLAPGRYRLEPHARNMATYPMSLTIAPSEPDSPLQRILYHEFREVFNLRSKLPPSEVDRKAHYRRYVRALSALGFTRETDRLLNAIGNQKFKGWSRGPLMSPPGSSRPDLPPLSVFRNPGPQEDWLSEFYLDQAVGAGVHYDTQLMAHCSAVPLQKEVIDPLVPVLQRAALRMGRYPSFYGFNYNDEMFFIGGAGWTPRDAETIEALRAEKLPNRPISDAYLLALRLTYQKFNEAVRLANPDIHLTATPMWQFPAVEGSYPPIIYEGMSESYSHFLSEGFDPLWYPEHSVEMLRRPDLPIMGVTDHHSERDAGYAKHMMQVLSRGAQGAGVEHVEIHNTPTESDIFRLTNDLARWYGPIFAEAPPRNEAAVLYSYSQDVTEKRRFLGTPHWEKVYCLLGAGLMSGIPMDITYEEDIAAGRLLENGQPRVGMVFLVGQTQPLPDSVRRGLRDFEQAGGKVYRDAGSSASVGGTPLDIDPSQASEAVSQGANGDAWNLYLGPSLKALATNLKTGVGDQRRFPVDTDDSYVSTSVFDGGGIRYLMLASETSPISLDPGAYWSLGQEFFNQNVFPRTVKVTLPNHPGVIYDAFEQTEVHPTIKGPKAEISADLSLYPGRLYALAPNRLGPPRIQAHIDRDQLTYRVRLETENGQPIDARVPVRIRLIQGDRTVLDQARGTGPDGVRQARINLPVGSEPCILEVTELLGGASARLTAQPAEPPAHLVEPRGPVDQERARLVDALVQIARNHKSITVVGGHLLEPTRREALTSTLKSLGLEIQALDALPESPSPRIVLAAGTIESISKKTGPRDHDPLQLGYDLGLFRSSLGPPVPGPSRGILSAYLAPRALDEHVIALVGGDRKGLDHAAQVFLESLEKSHPDTPDAREQPEAWTLSSTPFKTEPPFRLRDRVGVPLSGVKAASGGKHVVVSSRGFHRNLALVEDQGEQGLVLQAQRVGGSSRLESLFVTRDGERFGGSARFPERFGEGFALFDQTVGGRSPQVFTSVGHDESRFHEFGCSESGDVVLATGSHGAVCWERRSDGSWNERWSVDFFKEFDSLDWPVSPEDERVPGFHALIPPGSSVAYLLYSEKADTGWITPGRSGGGWLAALDLSDGHRLWKYDLNHANVLRFPRLVGYLGGDTVALLIQEGSWSSKSYQIDVVDHGQRVGTWTYATEPSALALSVPGGLVACSPGGQGLDVHDREGTLLLAARWPSQPFSLAFNDHGSHLLVADDLRGLTCLDLFGTTLWSQTLPSVSHLAVHGDRVYAAGTDGRLRAFSEADGRPLWTLDLTPQLQLPEANAAWTRGSTPLKHLIVPSRASTASTSVPEGPNLLRTEGVQVSVGGTRGWAAHGSVQVDATDLTDGRIGGLKKPWLSLSEQFWNISGGRQVWIEVKFPSPTPVHSVTIHEDPEHPEAWPSDGLVQVWDDARGGWKTARWGAFMDSPTSTYKLDLPSVTRLRYVPWTCYGQNLYTSEIEVR